MAIRRPVSQTESILIPGSEKNHLYHQAALQPDAAEGYSASSGTSYEVVFPKAHRLVSWLRLSGPELERCLESGL